MTSRTSRALTALAIVAALLGVALLAPRAVIHQAIAFMDRHQGVSGWFQAVFSVAAILASSFVAILVPREMRRLEQRDQRTRALSAALTAMQHARIMINTVRIRIEDGEFDVYVARTGRLELECRLEDLSAARIDALPRPFAYQVYGRRTEIRTLCIALSDAEAGLPVNWADFPFTEIALAIDRLERQCEHALEALSEDVPPAPRPPLVKTRVGAPKSLTAAQPTPAPAPASAPTQTPENTKTGSPVA